MLNRTRPYFWMLTIIMIVMLTPVALADHRDHVAARPRQHVESERLKVQAEQQSPQQATPPRADYTTPEPQDPTLRQLRKNRSKQYELFDDTSEQTVELTRVKRDRISMPEFPIYESDLIVLGAVTNARGM